MPDQRHVRYGPSDRYPPPPPAGFCISVFAVIQHRGKTLTGVAREHPRWLGDWIPQLRIYPADYLAKTWKLQRIPGCYLREHEHPEDALARIVKQQVGAKQYKVTGLDVGSWSARSSWYPGERHWDLTFTYHVQAKLPARTPAWWTELSWKNPRDLKPAEFGWNSDFVRDLGIATKR